MKKAIFLDRDGVINENVKDLIREEQVKLLPNVAQAIKKINQNNFLCVVVTNQPIVAKGFCTLEDINEINKKILQEIKKQEPSAQIEAFYICPHHPEKGFEGEVPELKINCDCRKPKPGMLRKAAAEYAIDLEQSWMIGDSKSDITAGKAAGCKTILLQSGGGSGAKQEQNITTKPDANKEDLLEAVEFLFSSKNTL